MSNLRNQLQSAAADYAAARCPIDLAAGVNALLDLDAAGEEHLAAEYPGDLAEDVRRVKVLTYRLDQVRPIRRRIVVGSALAASIFLAVGVTYFSGSSRTVIFLQGSGGVGRKFAFQDPGNFHPASSIEDISTADRLPVMSDALAALDNASDATTDTAVTSDSTSTDSPALTVIQSQDTISVSLPSMDAFPSVPSFPMFDASDSSSTSTKS